MMDEPGLKDQPWGVGDIFPILFGFKGKNPIYAYFARPEKRRL